MTRHDEKSPMPELPSTEKGPRSPADQEHTGAGTSRSAEEAFRRAGGPDPNGLNAEVDPAVVTGATTSSHPAAADGVEINRSGSGGTGGPVTDDTEAPEGQRP